ncbi:MAG: hypothetical protein ABSE53_07650 [Terracidiphilus sp.]|jgi:hypothetical protein
MSGLDRDQLEALRDRVEEDYRRAEENYRLDIAAIEHLQHRFFGAVSSIPTSNDSRPINGSNSESPTTILPPQSTPARPQSDELEDSLRSMFHPSHR